MGPTCVPKSVSAKYDEKVRKCGCGCGQVVQGRRERRHMAKKRQRKLRLQRQEENRFKTQVRSREDDYANGAEDARSVDCESDPKHSSPTRQAEGPFFPESERASENDSDISERLEGEETEWCTFTQTPMEVETAASQEGPVNPSCDNLSHEDDNESGYFSDEDATLDDLKKDLAWMELFRIKEEFSISQACYHALRKWFHKRLNIKVPSLFLLEKIVATHAPKDLKPSLVEACPAGCVLFKDKNLHNSSCPVCQEDRWYPQGNNSTGRKPKGLFVHYSAKAQLSAILNNPTKVKSMENYVKSFQDRNSNLKAGEEPDVVSDYFDGQAYLTACQQNVANFGKEKTLYLALSTDGVEYSKKPTKSVWPFALEIINLPPQMRRQMDNAVVVGILFGYPKDMTSVLRFLVDELNSWNHTEWKLQFSYLIADTPALNKLLGFVGHTGMIKCPQHTHRGFYSPNHNTYYMPNELPRSTSKDNREALAHASNRAAHGVPVGATMDRVDSVLREGLQRLSAASSSIERENLKQEYGLSDTLTPLNRLPGFRYYTAATYEALHISLLGVGRLVMRLYCSRLSKYPSPPQNDFALTDSQLDDIAEDVIRFSKSIHPQLMARNLRSPKDGFALRAEDMSNMLFVLPVLLYDRIGADHVKGAANLVKSIALMAQTSLTREERDSLDDATSNFLDYFYRTFYQRSVERMNVCTYVVHRFGDAPQLARLHGPGWTTWSFFVESLGRLVAGSIRSMSHPEASAARTVHNARQLATAIPMINSRIARMQERRKRDPRFGKPFFQRHEALRIEQMGLNDENDMDDFDHGADEGDNDQEAELQVCLSALHQLPQDMFKALVRLRFPTARTPTEVTRLARELGASPSEKYVTTFRKLRAHGFTFVGEEASSSNQRDRSYAIAELGQGTSSIVQIHTFFNHSLKGTALNLFAYRRALGPTIHPHVGELSFQKWSGFEVADVSAIQRPAAIVYRQPSGRGTLGRYFFVSRVEMLKRIRFDENTV